MPFLSDRFHDQQQGGTPALNGLNRTGTFDAAAIAERIGRRVLGQDDIVEEIRQALVVVQAGFHDRERPLSTLLLVGPTGVGKTEIVRRLAAELRSGPDDFCRVDMGQLAQEHYAAALSGAPPGYSGSREGSSVFDRPAIEGSPFIPGIVLFDEVEKAHPVVLRALLGLLDRGMLALSNGEQRISFRNAFVFLTSNLGSADIARRRGSRRQRVLDAIPGTGGLRRSQDHATIDAALRDFFDPEFLNRIDRVLRFNEISRHVAHDVVQLHLNEARELLRRRGVEMECRPGALEALVDVGFDPVHGARSLQRALRRHVLAPTAELLVAARADATEQLRVRLEPEAAGRSGVRVRSV
ncbi:ATP-dependent protease ATP-binding subunit-like protein AmiB [Pseudonocardia sulfidoxydans NBRC 16205]|uniref:ATP-dependent protease ATP-binding subunit-like protein AmiB n=1 Tax=Pseudonocardia sulfidoxydans NBRC 16205 TaxID=1223511 RepID=A0A511DJN5_9PSEU|nr:AAA family ATPase [Pseudonocardia sulfidoxydans]GEL25012.1 ATP-dependent protease ATP-binding subunit-like protein AmiB [Pseudonocardia sulfidoxydans NBRC 16205]